MLSTECRFNTGLIFGLLFLSQPLLAQKKDSLHHSVARRWNEAMLQTIREDFARPPVQARNLFHLSIALYDAWAIYDTVAKPYFLGNSISGVKCPCNDFPRPADIETARKEAMSYAAFRLLNTRFYHSPKGAGAIFRFRRLMEALGYDPGNYDFDYAKGSPASLGNYLGQCLIELGKKDGSNEQNNYVPQYYKPINEPLDILVPGDKNVRYINRWQPLKLPTALDQNGNRMPPVQVFQSPEWGLVTPFALKREDRKIYIRDTKAYWVYHDPGPFPTLDTLNATGTSDDFKWNFAIVPAWASHLDPADGVIWDISPRSIGNVQHYPENLAELRDFYDFKSGKDAGKGRELNPRTGQPYQPQMVPRGDYTRVLTQFWADGPTSETPPGHWFSIFNYVCDQPELVRRFNGKGPLVDTLEWDVKGYFALGGAMHDAAITAWGIKGWYDGVRPLSAVRYMTDRGQSSDPKQPSYHPLGIPLTAGLIEVVKKGDPLAGKGNEHVGKIKFYTWRGTRMVKDTANEVAGVGWILAQDWVPYQLKTFVTPPFAGYISGHSTYSRAAAETLTLFTGDEYFPRGLGEFPIKANSNFLRLEKGPSVDIVLQWATYRDASDQTSMSRIWGGIHPPFDDIPGRLIGAKVGIAAFNLSRQYFYRDADKDGVFNYEDSDDKNAKVK
jgi:hypothetical protein